ncbi:MAG: methylated-DNA--[protein]-cysteine S-methyltransferase [Hyphomicrobiaceae bacterium]
MNTSDAPGHYALFPTELGICGIAWRDGHVISTNLPEPSEAEIRDRLVRRSGGAEPGTPPQWVRQAIDAITALLAGNPNDLAFIPCDYGQADDFRVKIYQLTRTIPPGETTTYGDIAERLGNKRFAQAVGQAMGHNPLPIIVPCHRVMGANGKLTGFSANGGIETKLRMLDIERAAIGAEAGLFGHLPLAIKPK